MGIKSETKLACGPTSSTIFLDRVEFNIPMTMPLSQSPMAIRAWSKDQYLISTDASLIPAAELGELFDSGEMYWATSLPVDQIRQMLDGSLSFGVFEVTSASEKVSSSEVHLLIYM